MRQTRIDTLLMQEVPQVVLGDKVVPESDVGAVYAEGNLRVRHIVCVADFMFNDVREALKIGELRKRLWLGDMTCAAILPDDALIQSWIVGPGCQHCGFSRDR